MARVKRGVGRPRSTPAAAETGAEAGPSTRGKAAPRGRAQRGRGSRGGRPMNDANDWQVVSPGFKLEPPILRWATGRPRKLMLKASSHDKGSRLGIRKNKCKLCGGFGHVKRLCENPDQHEVLRMHDYDQVHDHRLYEIHDDHEVREMPQYHQALEMQDVKSRNCRHQLNPLHQRE